MTGNQERDTFMPSGNGLPPSLSSSPDPNSLRFGMMGMGGGLAESLDLGIANTPHRGDPAKRMRSGLLQLKISHIFLRNSINFLSSSLKHKTTNSSFAPNMTHLYLLLVQIAFFIRTDICDWMFYVNVFTPVG